MAAAPVVIAAMEPAQSALTSRKSWPKIRCCSPSQDLEAVEGKERQNRANITNSVCSHLSFNPPTPAFAKAGAAPGTTAGVEPVFVGLPLPCLPPAPTRHQGHSHSMSQPHCTRQTLQRSPGLKPLKCLKPSAAAWTRHSGHSPLLLRAFQPAICQSLKMPKTLRDSFDQTLRPLSSVVKGVQACRLPGRLPGLKCLKRCAAASSRHSGHCPLLLRAFKPAVCQASNA